MLAIFNPQNPDTSIFDWQSGIRLQIGDSRNGDIQVDLDAMYVRHRAPGAEFADHYLMINLGGQIYCFDFDAARTALYKINTSANMSPAALLRRAIIALALSGSLRDCPPCSSETQRNIYWNDDWNLRWAKPWAGLSPNPDTTPPPRIGPKYGDDGYVEAKQREATQAGNQGLYDYGTFWLTRKGSKGKAGIKRSHADLVEDFKKNPDDWVRDSSQIGRSPAPRTKGEMNVETQWRNRHTGETLTTHEVGGARNPHPENVSPNLPEGGAIRPGNRGKELR